MSIFVLIAAVIVALAVQHILLRRGSKGLLADVGFDTDAAEPGEAFRIQISVRNSTRIIYPFVRFSILVPEEFEITSSLRAESSFQGSCAYTGSCFLLPKKTFTKTIDARCEKRGIFRCGSIIPVDRLRHRL